MISNEKTKVWRYMSYARFVWLLQKKALWLSRSDLLGDKWEMSLAGEQLDRVIKTAPISPIGEPRREDPRVRAESKTKSDLLMSRPKMVGCWGSQQWPLFHYSISARSLVSVESTRGNCCGI